MIVDERTYTVQTGSVSRVLELYEAEGLAIQVRHLGRLVGYFTAETGVLNQIVHLWAFDSWTDRQERRAALWADPAWVRAFEQVAPFYVRMENRILVPTRFSPLR